MKVIIYGTGLSYGHSLDWFVKQSFSLSKSVKSPKIDFRLHEPEGRAHLILMHELDEASAFHIARARRASAIRLQRTNQEERVGFIYMQSPVVSEI